MVKEGRSENVMWFLVFLGAGLVVALLVATSLQANEVNADGVIALERVIDLPQDQGKWYLSIVGKKGEAQYDTLLAWFTSNGNLISLRNQVHYRMIESDTAIYKERYASNVKGLPTVRLQKHNGVTVYESQGDSLPISAGGLYNAIANSANKAQGKSEIFPWRRSKRLCPLRRPCPQPKPEPRPDPPAPPLNVGPPVFVQPEPEIRQPRNLNSAGIGAGVALLCFFTGCGVSLFVLWKEARGKTR